MSSRQSSSNTALWIVLGVVVLGVLAVAGVAVLGVGVWLFRAAPAKGPGPAAAGPAVSSAPGRPTMTRDEFRQAVMGKTPAEVEAAVGKPDSTSESARSRYWYYRERTVDPVTGKTDYHAQVAFRDGRVAVVNY